MADTHTQWITLDSPINDYIIESEQSIHKYYKLFNLAFRCMEDLGLDFFYQIKSIKLDILPNKTILLPADYLNYTKMGILDGNGGLIPLTWNDKLTYHNDQNPSRLADVSSNIGNTYSFTSPTFYNYWNGSSYSNFYGVSYAGLSGGGFKIDEANGVILLDPTFGYTNLIMEYVASPQEGQEYYLPMQFREAMIAWLAWKDIANIPSSRKGNLGDKRDRRHEYFEARRKGIRQYRPFHLDQAHIADQQNQRLVVKS
jgi:hypothetical protein